MTSFAAVLSASLAFADSTDNSNGNLVLVMISLALLAGTALLAAIPLLAAPQRRRGAEALMAASALWALLAGGLALLTLFGRSQWSRENLILMQSGYYDPSTAVPPPWHWGLWVALAVAYIVLVAVTFSGKDRGGGGK